MARRVKTSKLLLGLLTLLCHLGSVHGFFGWFSRSWRPAPEANPFAAVYHEPLPEEKPPPSLTDKILVFGSNGLPPSDETCWSSDVPPNPRRQKVLIALEAYCPGNYNLTMESFCSNSVRAFERKCINARLPIDDKRLRFYASTELKRLKSTPKGTYKAAYTGFMRRLAPQMREKGWTDYSWSTYNNTWFWRRAREADVIILSILNFRNVIRVLPNKRYILVQTNDGATLSFALGCDLDDPRILGVLQHTALRDISENNEPVLQSRRHFTWLTPDLEDSAYRRRVPPLNPSQISKIHVAIPQVYRWRYPLDCGGSRNFAKMIPAFKKPKAQWMKPFHQRKYDLAFLGTITDSGSRDYGGINEHRRAAVQAIEGLQQKYPWLNVFLPHHTQTLGHLPYAHFLQILKDTKVFVSPFGLGEFSGKDYEAMLTGALLVKPWSHKLQAYPNIYNETFTIDVDLNFADLEEKVMPWVERCAKGDLPCEKRHQVAEEWSVMNWKRLQRFMNLDALADDWDRLLLSMVSREANFTCGRCMQSQRWMYDKATGKPLSRKDLIMKALREKRELPDMSSLYDGRGYMLRAKQHRQQDTLVRNGVTDENGGQQVEAQQPRPVDAGADEDGHGVL